MLKKFFHKKSLNKGRWAGHSITNKPQYNSSPSDISKKSEQRTDWSNSPDVQTFFGREKELATLYNWLTDKKVHIVNIIGMGGIGKSSLTLRLCKGLSTNDVQSSVTNNFSLADEYDCIVWKDLLDGPLLSEILIDTIQYVSNFMYGLSVDNEWEISKLINLLLVCFKRKRCLLILDNVETILQSGEQIFPGEYRQEYRNYEQMFLAIGKSSHQSCLILNSREKPHGIAKMETDFSDAIRTYDLKGLDIDACKKIFQAIGNFEGIDMEWKQVNQIYNGNPLALKLLALHISEVYFGNIGDFLGSKQILFGEINELVKWHIERMSAKQLEVLFWMALFREPITFTELKSGILDYQSQAEVASTLYSLMTRIPIEKMMKTKKFFLQPVIIEYLLSMLIEGVIKDIIENHFSFIHNYALFHPKIKESVRELHKKVLVNPINQRLIGYYKSAYKYEEALRKTIINTRNTFSQQKNYVAGNIIGLLSEMNNCISDYNFSNLSICGVDLQNITLHNINFSDSTIEECRFRQTFGPISSVAISRDGNYIAANEATGIIHVWRTSDNQIVHNLIGHVSWIFGLTFSSDGNYLASGGEDKTVRLWNLDNCTSIVLGRHNNSVWALTFSWDDKYLASGSEDGTIKIFEVVTGQCIHTISAHTEKVFSVSFSHDNRYLLSASSNGSVKLWEVNNNFCLMKVVDQSNTTVRCAVYNTEDSVITSCDWNGKIKFLTASDDKIIPLKTFDCNEPLHFISYHPNAPFIAASGESGKIYIWNYLTNSLERILNKHSGEVWKIEFSGDGRYLISGGYDGVLIIWDVESWTCESLLCGYIDWIQDVAISPDDTTLACSNGDMTLNIWDIDNSRLIHRFIAHSGWAFSVEYNPNGKYVASGSDDLKIKLWNPQRWKSPPQILSNHKKWIQAVAFTPDGGYLASADDDGVLLIWDIELKDIVYTLSGHSSGVWSVAFSHDGNLLASADESGAIILWDWKKEKIKNIFKGHSDRIHEVCFDILSSSLYSCSEDFSVRKWSITSGDDEILYTHGNWVMAVITTKDDKYIFSGDKNGYMIRYNKQTKSVMKWRAHGAGIWTIVMTNNDNYVISAGEDGKVKIWDKENLTLAKTLQRPKPYDGLDISRVKGLPEAQLETLKQLGAKKYGFT